jgi:transposase-like protein
VEKKYRGRYTLEFRQYAVERMRVCVNISALAKELGVARVLLYQWRERLEPLGKAGGSEGFRAVDEEKFTLQQQLRQAKQLLAEKTLELDFFKGALQKIEARRQRSAKTGGTTSTSRSGK